MPTSVELVEIFAASRAVQFTVELGYQQAIFEGDSGLVFKALSEGVQSLLPLGHLVKDFMSIVGLLRVYFFSRTRRQSNCVAHVLARRTRFFSLY